MVIDVFALRFLTAERPPAAWLKGVMDRLNSRKVAQILFLYVCRDNCVLADFVREVYWPMYAAGRDVVSNEDACRFVECTNPGRCRGAAHGRLSNVNLRRLRPVGRQAQTGTQDHALSH